MNKISPKTAKKIQTLQKIAVDLRKGKNFDITRLTMLKGLCEDSDAAAQFALFLAKKSPKAIKESRWLSSEEKQQYGRLASKAVRKMAAFLKAPNDHAQESLRELLSEVRDVQNEHKRVKWATVRIIQSRQLLVVEKALECILHPWASADLGYRIARQSAERYDPRYGTGLIPESAPAVEDITEFWGRYFLGRGWRKRLEA